MKQSVVMWVVGVATVASVAGVGTSAALTRDVTLVVDGQAVAARVPAGTVADALADEDVVMGEHDLVSPALDTPLVDGLTITVSYAREAQVTVDGVTQDVWTTAATVDGVLAGLGLTDPAIAVSPARDTRLTVEGLVVTATTPKQVTLTAGGVVTTFETTAATVADLMAERGLVPDADDRLSADLSTPLVGGLALTFQRVETSQVTVEGAVVAYETQKKNDSSLEAGQTKVETAGVNGAANQVWSVTTVDGVEESRTLVSQTVTTAPVTEVVVVGTKPKEVAVAAPASVTPGSAQDIARSLLPSYGFSDNQFGCLVNLWKRESGWSVNATNKSSGAYGIPQALPGSKMASAGSDWRTNPATQIKWGLSYIKGRYGTPCGAWAAFQSKGWY